VADTILQVPLPVASRIGSSCSGWLWHVLLVVMVEM